MPMREPDITAAPDVLELLHGNLVGHRPASEIGTACDPRVGCQNRLTVETDDCGVADRLKADHDITSRTVGHLSGIQFGPGALGGQRLNDGSAFTWAILAYERAIESASKRRSSARYEPKYRYYRLIMTRPSN
jgi:hypothetical protein